MTLQPEFAPLSAGELLRRYPPGRITGWDITNAAGVEEGFRRGYLTGTRRFVESRGFGFVQDEPGDMELDAPNAQKRRPGRPGRPRWYPRAPR